MLQLKPNQWSCAITSLAMVLRVPVQELIDRLGHDGSQIVFPDLEEPMCRRGFHSQELMDLALQWGFIVSPVELFPTIKPTYGDGLVTVHFGGNEATNWCRFNTTIDTTIGILEGRSGRWHHTVHYRHGDIWDPDGAHYSYSRRACEYRGFFANRALIFTCIQRRHR